MDDYKARISLIYCSKMFFFSKMQKKTPLLMYYGLYKWGLTLHTYPVLWLDQPVDTSEPNGYAKYQAIEAA